MTMNGTEAAVYMTAKALKIARAIEGAIRVLNMAASNPSNDAENRAIYAGAAGELQEALDLLMERVEG